MNVWNDEWVMHSSTNSRSIGVLFRIRNTAAANIAWGTRWYFSCYQYVTPREGQHCHIGLWNIL